MLCVQPNQVRQVQVLLALSIDYGWRAGYLIGVYAAVRREPDGGIWAAVRPSVASSTAPRRGSDVLMTTLDHPGAGAARDGGGEQQEYAYYVFLDSCERVFLKRVICKEPTVEEPFLFCLSHECCATSHFLILTGA